MVFGILVGRDLDILCFYVIGVDFSVGWFWYDGICCVLVFCNGWVDGCV